jgi:hypothetical protein
MPVPVFRFLFSSPPPSRFPRHSKMPTRPTWLATSSAFSMSEACCARSCTLCFGFLDYVTLPSNAAGALTVRAVVVLATLAVAAAVRYWPGFFVRHYEACMCACSLGWGAGIVAIIALSSPDRPCLGHVLRRPAHRVDGPVRLDLSASRACQLDRRRAGRMLCDGSLVGAADRHVDRARQQMPGQPAADQAADVGRVVGVRIGHEAHPQAEQQEGQQRGRTQFGVRTTVGGTPLFGRPRKASRPPMMPKIAPEAPTLFTCGFHSTLARLPTGRRSGTGRRSACCRRCARPAPTCHSASMLKPRCQRLPCRNIELTRRHHSPPQRQAADVRAPFHQLEGVHRRVGRVQREQLAQRPSSAAW